MKTSDRGIVALISHEGIVPGPYRDSVDVWTAYVGHTAAAGSPDPAKMARGIPADLNAALRAAFDVLRKDLATYEAAVTRALKVPVSQHEFDALVSFHFNTGAIARAQLMMHLNAGDRRAAADAFMGWSKPAEIIPRRKAEQDLFRNGRYPTGKLTVWGVDGSGRVIWTPLRTLTADEALAMMHGPAAAPAAAPRPAAPEAQPDGFWAALIAALRAAFSRK